MRDAAIAPKRGTVWTIHIRAEGDHDLNEHITLSSDAGYAYWFENGVVIQTIPTGFGDFKHERVVPWSRVIEYFKEER